ncbi:hypothetical protein FIV06_23895 [Labrenzia sp. THAF191b]|uniref:hypothetical protein n=1 Tax=unclassified Labrenzia TaxID=2648686 RepID=UPI001268E8D1|nr:MULTISPECIES: hypothetical protein [unclassified Labrenzia]QFT00492.1 hypothetical protein FIV06_23895 [Labrenzia sp. THAF191b]QFT06805.1 hypothetical protein FIV05_23890 [Labrenzia sp. THAF191a]QFT18349.1 hypothetical protein FIV03_23905 [Labrenzia sp. THAF187b]
MKITMKTGMAGKDFALDPGETTERFSDAEAKRLIAAGIAEKATKGDVTVGSLKKELSEVTAERDKLTKTVEVLQDDLRATKDALTALEAAFDAKATEETSDPAAPEVRG